MVIEQQRINCDAVKVTLRLTKRNSHHLQGSSRFYIDSTGKFHKVTTKRISNEMRYSVHFDNHTTVTKDIYLGYTL